jgi:serralysin
MRLLGQQADAFDGHTLGLVGNDWQIQGLGDFNGDLRSDILWRNAAGDVYVSQSQITGGQVSLVGQSISSVPNDWTIQGVGDFNGDGRSDILWRNVSGEVYVWNSNTNADISFVGQSLSFVALDWHVADIADLNGDGRSDILWRRANGDVYAWNSHASGAVAFDGQGLGNTPTAWHIISDFHGV